MHPTYPPRPALRTLALLALTVLAATTATACSSSSSSTASTAALYGTALQQECTSVADVLADGPDPTADPVGYAQAQVLPLRQLTIGDPALRGAVTRLATAYQNYATSTGAANVAAALAAAKAEAAVNSICPGAAN